MQLQNKKEVTLMAITLSILRVMTNVMDGKALD